MWLEKTSENPSSVYSLARNWKGLSLSPSSLQALPLQTCLMVCMLSVHRTMACNLSFTGSSIRLTAEGPLPGCISLTVGMKHKEETPIQCKTHKGILFWYLRQPTFFFLMHSGEMKGREYDIKIFPAFLLQSRNQFFSTDFFNFSKFPGLWRPLWRQKMCWSFVRIVRVLKWAGWNY